MEILKTSKMKFPPKVKISNTINAVEVALKAIDETYLVDIPEVNDVKTGITPRGFTIVNNDVNASNVN